MNAFGLCAGERAAEIGLRKKTSFLSRDVKHSAVRDER